MANKMGTTAEHLFPQLVASAKLEAGLWMFGGTILGCLLIIAACFLVYKVINDNWDDIAVMPAAIMSVIAVVLIIAAIESIPDFYYPEAEVIRSLVGK